MELDLKLDFNKVVLMFFDSVLSQRFLNYFFISVFFKERIDFKVGNEVEFVGCVIWGEV